MTDTTASDDAQSITDSLRSDHHAITELLDDPRVISDDAHAAALREQLVMIMVRHYVAEEQYLYPNVREHIESGVTQADEGLSADRAAEAELRLLENPDLNEQRLRQAVDRIASHFREHLDRQVPLFQALEGACPPQVLDELGRQARGAEQAAPTSPRRIAPSSPTANKILSVVQGFVDQVRDHYTHRGVDTESD